MKFLIEFLLNQNFIDHLILVKFIFQKLKDLVLPDFPDQIPNVDFPMSKNYSMFNFIDGIIVHCEKSLDRLKSALSKEQGVLAISDETLQTGIIKSIEFLEENIEKNILTNNAIHSETLALYLDLYFTVKNGSEIKDEKEKDKSLVFAEEKEFLFEKILLFVQKNKNKLESKVKLFAEEYGKKEKRVNEIFENFDCL